MTDTDFFADGLISRYVTGGNNQGNAVASLHTSLAYQIVSEPVLFLVWAEGLSVFSWGLANVLTRIL
ncbi:hypothetical protein C7B06_13555 [Escherichia coli]|nr:hypothetical protein C7B06_13555 [Escherichia coli]PSZ17070.1 hypothetical protein C7B07_15365 [Escherichia coli]